ncbi:hypothetical protein [Streptomyces peucetius]|uniref:Uncharacterized protein n=1 Tax=Streptomyces peucetius TaxID=1950 RepID=A0ABY6I227_STRPE|nr:hypothetical protein [Streptomyces peucetius]UYQ60034.1 hypothetical protein OGH68_00040 [Streptomyces peucetius]
MADFREFLSVVVLTAVLAVVTAVWHSLMRPVSGPPTTWDDWEIGIELLVAGGGIVLASLIAEKTPYPSTKLLTVGITAIIIFGGVVCARIWGYDSNGNLTKRASLQLSALGCLGLSAAYAINKQPGILNELWHSVFPN